MTLFRCSLDPTLQFSSIYSSVFRAAVGSGAQQCPAAGPSLTLPLLSPIPALQEPNPDPDPDPAPGPHGAVLWRHLAAARRTAQLLWGPGRGTSARAWPGRHRDLGLNWAQAPPGEEGESSLAFIRHVLLPRTPKSRCTGPHIRAVAGPATHSPWLEEGNTTF